MKILTDHQSIMTSYLLMAIFLALLIPLHLLASFFAGFVIFEIINSLGNITEKYIDGQRARITISVILGIIIVTLITLGITSLVSFMQHDVQGSGVSALSDQIDQTLQKLQLEIAQYIPGFIPYTLPELKDQSMDLLKDNLSTLKHTGTDFIHNLATMLIASIVGILVSLNRLHPQPEQPVFKRAMIKRIENLSTAFKNVVFAQFKISLINTALFFVFSHILLPIFGVQLPFANTLVILTFIFGLIPIVGNLISNTIIVITGLTISVTTAGVALIYLILIHKLEYFINAKIIGTKIHAASWEVLLAMLVFEAIFGLAGLIVAPIFYAYIKLELKKAEMI
ncbi:MULTISPECIES: AI-2E family transporter [unclassified Acinetobacter]|uniref:AI-2E family transporter n=1 Tax=unclassified Acinetobacter TaxID=196816 RepID=UPI0010233252|nr:MULTISPECIES: AI-2E family transporter [unclassified Acinetobacter]RZG75763.1 AI-2E family transporter [Acinetobacter sp. WCHAc060025]RZG82735.1 AI-2E family transporter [Acinetobacter sp. WCHAc060033]